MHYTIAQLQQIDAQSPKSRKLLLVPSINYGRELLASLAMRQGGWIGWEVATLGTLAAQLAVVELARRVRRRASDVAVANAVNVAFERAVGDRDVAPALASLAWNAGTRRAVSDAILELRVAGVEAHDLAAVGSLALASSLTAILRRYEQQLSEGGIADVAEVFRAALASFDEQAPYVLDHEAIVAVPGWSVRGLPRQLFQSLERRGLRILSSESSAILNPPSREGATDESTLTTSHEMGGAKQTRAMFYAASPDDEIRSVVRQTVALGRSLDEVEIATTDRDTYGASLDALSEQLGVSYTSLDGLPIYATRVGRAVDRWLRWIDSGYHASIIREALESNDFDVGAGIESPKLAAEFRTLKTGWGLDSIERAVLALRSPRRLSRVRQSDEEDDAVYAARLEERSAMMDGLATFLDEIASIAPRPNHEISTADLASRTKRLLNFVRPRGAAESATRQRLIDWLTEIAAVDDKPVQLPSALASLRQELADLRAWTDGSHTTKPRRATGGHLHLTSIENAGTTGRPLLFVVGLDANRTAGALTQSPLLPDILRARLGDSLPTSDVRRRERAAQLQRAISIRAERVTLSYAARAVGDGREVGPAPVLLDAAREWSGNAELTYRDLKHLLGEASNPVLVNSAGREVQSGAIARPVEAAIDDRDVWLEAMNNGALLLDATDALRQAHPMLDRGIAANEARSNAEATSFHGLVPDAGELDPRAHEKSISPSSLERIAACGLRWFYADALGARNPDEPTFDALVWLNALDRGAALHRIYELLIGERLHVEGASVARSERISRVVNRIVREFEVRIPAPSESILAREAAALLEDATLFVATEHAAYAKEPWETVALESQFGGSDAPAELPLDDGTTLLLRGRVDRVDKLSDGTLRLIDYKTGRAFELDNKHGAFAGGRKLQLALYSPAISAALGGVVSRAEYRFTTAKGDGDVALADEALMADAPRVVRSLLDDVAAGRFLPTIDVEDCKYCDYSIICRVTRGRFETTSPRAEWADANAKQIEAYKGLLARRRSGDEE